MYNKKFLGKYLIRKTKSAAGKNVVIITGVFECDDPTLFHDNDEMWVSELTITGSEMLKFKDNIGSTSPEDFIEGTGQHPSSWKIKEKISLL